MPKSEKPTAFEKVMVSVPVNKATALLMGKGVHYTPAMKTGHMVHDETPPQMRTGFITHSDVYKELVGKRFGKFTVLGLPDESRSNKKTASWVVRCDCGRYERRKRTAFSSNEFNLQCLECQHVMRIKDKYKSKEK